ncbi:disease resistance protein [Dorcoceras hygrometricum]|uniref:Disease resistance protein n=1 Tax=Dorcoceras hygrometricum TaxID=472368 RepID=A0A2Z7BHQ6_9LAMI|nr:disease resistance protein [Dorcoceras hygrometricum]
MDILHLDSELGSGRLSKATVELLAAAPSSFLSPIRVYAPEDVNSFTAWWPPRRAVLAPTFDYPSGFLSFLHICLFFLLHCAWLLIFLAFAAKDTKASASVGITVAPSSAPVKSKKRKASSAPSRPIQSSRERKYSTRSSSRLVSSFSNTDDDPVDLVSSPPGLGDDDDSSGDEDAGNPQGSPTTEELIDDYSLEERNTGLVPESDPPCIPSDLSSRRARFQQLERSAINVDFGFSDAGTSTSSQLIRSVPSVESLSFAKAAVRNFLELGLHQLGETQRLAMISAVSILRVAPEFSSDSSLLENVATIFSDSDAAQARSTSLMAKVEDFHYKRRKAEGMEQENSSVRAQIQNLTTEYDTNEDEVKRLEEKILEHRAKMASLMDEAESLEKKLLSSRRDTQIIVDEVVSLKEEYGMGTGDTRVG